MIKNNKLCSYDVIIVGGSLSGLQMAVSLGSYGVSVCVIDRSKIIDILNDEFDGRTCAIASASSNLLKHTGVWEKVEKYASPMLDIHIQDGDVVKGMSAYSMHYDNNLVNGEALGYIFENNTLRRCQYERLCELDNVDYIEDSQVLDYQINDNEVIFKINGKTISGKLLLACDGKFSKIREKEKFKTINWDYKQTAIVCTVDTKDNHNGVALELFFPGGPFGVLPMQGNKMSVIWSEQDEIAKQVLKMNNNDFKEHLKQRFGDWLGDISVTDNKVYSYPLTAHHTTGYIKHRLALVGDSAHSMHPIAGQGFNMGIRDIASLTECIVKAKKAGRDIGSIETLKHYEQYRYFDNASLVLICDGLVKLFSNDIGIIRTLRVAGMGILNKIIPAKKFFMQHARGMVGTNIPSLLKKYTDL